MRATARASVRVPVLAALVGTLAIFAAACGDRSITRGADGEREWARKLAAAVPVGTPSAQAHAILERNGFRCQAVADTARSLSCDKLADLPANVVRRRWRAELVVDSGKVVAVRAATGLVRP